MPGGHEPPPPARWNDGLDPFRLDGKVAIITGASSGLGVDIATALAAQGADVVLGARREERLVATREAVEAEGRQAVMRRTDVSRPEDCDALVDLARATFGRVDILVNNAGVGAAVPASRETPDHFRQVVEINLFGAYWMAQACGRVMTPGSSIVNVASILGSVRGFLPQAAYAASKSGLLGLTRDLASQWTGRKGIRVNAVAPGYFDTEMTVELATNRDFSGILAHSVPMDRVGRPAELSAAVVFLASDAATYITGTVLPVDGGWWMP